MKLTRREEVAILLVSSIAAHHKHRVSLAQTAKEHGISLLFLKKIARSLRQSGIIDSKEGAGGGYTLAKDPSTVSVLDILRAVGSVEKEPVSLKLFSTCPIQPHCMPQKIRSFISAAFRRYCSNITIDQFLSKE